MVRRTQDTTMNYSINSLDLIRAVGYELKLPLTKMRSISSLLVEGEFSGSEASEQYRHLDLISRRMIQIIDSILYAGQVETNQMILHLEPTNISSVVYQVSQELKAIAAKYRKSLNLTVTSELLPAAVDRVALRHSLYGLIDLLIRSSDSSVIELLIHHQSDSVMVTLRDDGPGFSMKQVKLAFIRLGKSMQPIKQLPDSSGLALFVAYSLANAMNGELQVKQISEHRIVSLKLPLSKQMELI